MRRTRSAEEVANDILAVEFLVKTDNKKEYRKYINALDTLQHDSSYRDDYELLDFLLNMNMHTVSLAAMIIRGDYDDQKELVFEFLEKVLKRGERNAN